MCKYLVNCNFMYLFVNFNSTSHLQKNTKVALYVLSHKKIPIFLFDPYIFQPLYTKWKATVNSSPSRMWIIHLYHQYQPVEASRKLRKTSAGAPVLGCSWSIYIIRLAPAPFALKGSIRRSRAHVHTYRYIHLDTGTSSRDVYTPIPSYRRARGVTNSPSQQRTSAEARVNATGCSAVAPWRADALSLAYPCVLYRERTRRGCASAVRNRVCLWLYISGIAGVWYCAVCVADETFSCIDEGIRDDVSFVTFYALQSVRALLFQGTVLSAELKTIDFESQCFCFFQYLNFALLCWVYV